MMQIIKKNVFVVNVELWNLVEDGEQDGVKSPIVEYGRLGGRLENVVSDIVRRWQPERRPPVLLA